MPMSSHLWRFKNPNAQVIWDTMIQLTEAGRFREASVHLCQSKAELSGADFHDGLTFMIHYGFAVTHTRHGSDTIQLMWPTDYAKCKEAFVIP